MGRETHKGNKYTPGDWWETCDVCGFDYLRSELKIRWDDLLVCNKDYEDKPRKFRQKRIPRERPFRRR